MRVKVYASIVVDEIKISERDFERIKASHLNAIPDEVFNQIDDAIGSNVELNGIERIDTIEGDIIQEY